MNKIFAPFLPPWVETGLQPAFYDMESGTVLQQTARMYAKVQQLTRLFNELSEETQTTVDEYIAKFTELKDFVDDYFDNLDVQEEVNNKLDEMVEDGTFATLLQPYIDQINFIRVSDYYDEGDYINLQTLYDTAKTAKKNLYIDGEYKVNNSGKCVIDSYIEIYGGKLVADSFESTDNDTCNLFTCNAPCYIHDITFVSVADQIPSINRHAGLEYGFASNVKAVEIRSSNVTVERIKGDFVGGVGMWSTISNILTDIKIDKCYFKHCELGIFAENAEFDCTNCIFEQSSDVQSIYYHPFYLARALNSNINNIEVKANALEHPNVSLTEYLLADVIHLYNANNSYSYNSENVNISNINVSDGFQKFCQLRFSKNINFSNINAKIENKFFELGNRFVNINVDNCNILTVNPNSTARTIDTTASYVLDSEDSINIYNTTFNYETASSQYFACCNVVLDNCKINSNGNTTLPYNKADLAGYLKVHNCYIKVNYLATVYLGYGYVEYLNCHFDNTSVANYFNANTANTLNIKMIDCIVTHLKNVFSSDKINSNVAFKVYGYNDDHSEYREITNIVVPA